MVKPSFCSLRIAPLFAACLVAAVALAGCAGPDADPASSSGPVSDGTDTASGNPNAAAGDGPVSPTASANEARATADAAAAGWREDARLVMLVGYEGGDHQSLADGPFEHIASGDDALLDGRPPAWLFVYVPAAAAEQPMRDDGIGYWVLVTDGSPVRSAEDDAPPIGVALPAEGIVDSDAVAAAIRAHHSFDAAHHADGNITYSLADLGSFTPDAGAQWRVTLDAADGDEHDALWTVDARTGAVTAQDS